MVVWCRNEQQKAGPGRQSLDSRRVPLRVLYADPGLGNLFHNLVLVASGDGRPILPTWVSNSEQIRGIWTQSNFDCAILVLNNVMVPRAPDVEERIRGVLELLSWMRNRSAATIIAFSGLRRPEIARQAPRCGADRYFPLPFPVSPFVDFLRRRFDGTAGPSA